jgi:hypothetical protein
MTVARRNGNPGKADLLFSRIVRSRATCERCGGQATDTAHIVRRRYSATRCVEDNAWALCSSCHRATEDDPAQFMLLVDRTIGPDRYGELRLQAHAGIPGSSHAFWLAEVVRLTARCVELGIDTRRRVA